MADIRLGRGARTIRLVQVGRRGPAGPAGPPGPVEVSSVNGKKGAVILNAADIPYDGTESGITATNVQDAIDEIDTTSTSDVKSFNGRTGVVLPQSGDYTASQITNIPAGNISSVNVQDALNELDTALSNLPESGVSSVNGRSGAVVLDKNDVNLDNVDNTSDLNKPISTATQAALDGKQPLDADLTQIASLSPVANDTLQYIGTSWSNRTPAQVKTTLALNNVSNTSDANKPISTAQQAALDLKADITYVDAQNAIDEKLANKNQVNGYAGVGSDGKIPASLLPSYVDAVQSYPTLADFPATGTDNVIYVADDTGKAYRWSGTTYVEISASPGTTDDVPEGSINHYYTEARVDANANVSANTAARHTHANKALLDTYAQTETDLADAVVKKHTHDNMNDLNLVSGTNTGDQVAATVPNTPSGSITATNVQAALNELDTEKEGALPAGTTSQYLRGDKSWQTLDKTAVGLGNVDNTSDANKPISSATQTALNLKAPLASPVFTGTPTAPTPAAGDNDTSIATTAFVQGELAKSDTVITVGASNSDFNTSSYSGNLAIALQAAINSVAIDSGATIFVRAGTYTWTGSSAVFFGRRKIKLIGAGMDVVRVVADYNYTRPIFFQDSTIGLGNIEIAGFTWDASLRPNMGYIHLYQGDDIYIHHNRFTGQTSLVVDPIITSRSNWSVRVGSYVQTNASFLPEDVDITQDQIDIEKDFATGTQYTISSTGTLPAPLVAGTQYYAIRVNSLFTKVAASAADAVAGTAIDLTSQGTGQLTLTPSLSSAEVNVSTNVINISQNFPTGTQVSFTTTGTLPAPLVPNTGYFLIRLSSTTAQLATTMANAFAGTAIDLTDAGTGIFNYQLYNGQSRNVRFNDNVMQYSDAGTNEQLLFVNQRDGYVQNNVWRNNENQLAYEVICYINNQNVDISGNIFEDGDAHSIATMESQDISIHHNQFRSSKNFKFATVINSQNVRVTENIAKTTNPAHSNAFMHIFDRVPGPDGFAHIINASTSIVTDNNTIDGFNYGLYAQTLDDTYTMAFDGITFDNNEMWNIRTQAFTVGVNLPTNLLRNIFARNNSVYSWSGSGTGAFAVRGYDTLPNQVTSVFIEDNYVAPSSGAGDSAAVRLVGCNANKVVNNYIIGTGKGTFTSIEVENGATIDTCRNNDGYDNDEYINYGGF